jgi:hypothetical protein
MSRFSVFYRDRVLRSAQFLLGRRRNIRLVYGSAAEDIHAVLHPLKPIALATPLIRVGAQGDGGYLVPDLLGGISACFSPGVSKMADFELDLSNRGIVSFLADFSVDAPPFENPNFVFEKKFLGLSNDEKFMRFDDWVTRNQPGNSNDLLLQMDIEGAEYPVLLDVSEETLQRFSILLIEFHNFEMVFEPAGRILLNSVFQKILRHFSPVHIHPNNHSPAYHYNGVKVPSVLEFTFLRKDLVQTASHPLTFPHQLDCRNDTQQPDIVLPKHWWA